ncbi:Myb domain protein 4r1 [Tanacetum coccineum]
MLHILSCTWTDLTCCYWIRVCFWNGTRLFESKEEWGGREVKEKNVVVPPLVEEPGLGGPVLERVTVSGNEAEVVVLLESIRAIRERFVNTGLFFFQFSFMDGLNSMLENEDVGNVPVWVKLHDVPATAFCEDELSAIAIKLGTPLMLDSYTSDMCIQSWGRSSYARALIEIQADVDSTSTTPIVEKFNKIERLIIDGKVTLMDDEGKPLKKVNSSGDYDSEDEVESVDNEMESFFATKNVGYGTDSLLE